MAKFVFKTKKRNKFNFIFDKGELLDSNIITGTHLEMFSNKKVILDGCVNITDYNNDFVKLKLKKGYIILMGSNFVISAFENENIIINGNISSIEFSV